MAARSNDQEEEIWGTWEELILACLVERHGPHSWDSVSSEIRSRSAFSHRLTPDTCRNRYHHLKNRFGHVGDGGDGDNPVGDEDKKNEIPWLEELRKLRVAELRHEVQRHDDSIGSLQLKVKKLKEEREIGSELDSKEEESHSRKEIVGKIIAGEDSGRSCKESNCTETKDLPDVKPGDRVKVESDRVVNGSRSGSVNANPNRNENESSSDVQSPTCRRKGGGGASTSVSVFKKMDEVEVESQPLIAFLQIIKSSKDGLVFDKRLESQESVLYRSTIRRHVDLKTVENRIGTVGYRCTEFFRDLLILCNNAIVFYSKNSAESISAARLRTLINREMSARLYKIPRRSLQLTKEPTRPKPTATQPNKSTMSVPLVACSKRGSAKPIKKEEAEVTENGKEKREVKEIKSRGPRTYKGRGKKAGPVLNPKPEPNPKFETTEQVKASNTKKRGMNFLNRLKSCPPPDEKEKVGVNSKNGRGKNRGKEEGKKKEAGVKRNVGRPPKRGGKRGREEEKAESPVRRKRRRR